MGEQGPTLGGWLRLGCGWVVGLLLFGMALGVGWWLLTLAWQFVMG